MKPIYKVIDKQLTAKMTAELDNVSNYMKECMEKAKEFVPALSSVAVSKCPFSGKHNITGLILDEDADISLFKKVSTTKDGSEIFVPKRNSKKAKELDKKLSFIGDGVMLFDNKKFEEDLGYNPKQREVFEGNYLTINSLRLAYSKKKDSDKPTFVFQGYDGYAPNERVQEITISEYNALFRG